MTQRYISAINIADRRAAAILRKRAKKRPLGDIESKYGYTPPQPVLSCRTVDVDLSGTRTYRPKSSTDILQEQHQLIHKIYSKNRNIKSAPLNQKNQNEGDMNLRKLQRINIEVQGRPYTSLSQVSKSNTKTPSSSTKKQRPKTTGSSQPKKTEMRDSFMIIRVDKDVLDSARSSKQLTNQIHEMWQPEHHDLNQGKYIRGQKNANNSHPEQFNTWLTFGGNQDDEEHGLVDAFTGVHNQNEYYSIDGNVGNKVAATLKKGDKVRIGVNGVVHSNRIQRIKKESIQPVSKEESELFGGDIDAFNDIVLENFDDLMAPKKKKADSTPLNWTDQVAKTDVKVVESKGQVVSPRVVNLCESHPVVFERLVKSDERPKLARGNTESGFKVKHRLQKQPESSQSKYHHVKNIEIDSKSTKEDRDVDNMTLDDVLRNAIAHRNQYNVQSFNFQKDKFNSPNTENRIKSAKVSENGRENRLSSSNSSKSRAASDVVHSSGTGNLLIPVMRSVPSTLPATINSDDLSVSAPGARQSSPVNEMPRKSISPNPRNSTSAKSRASRISSAASNKHYQPPSDAQYIKFSSSIRNPKGDHSHISNNKQTVCVRFAGDVDGESVLSSKQDLDIDSVGGLSDRSVASRPMSPPQHNYNGYSINIPTADMLSDRDSMLQSPYKRSDDGEVLTNRQQRDKNMRDEQINQITTMLAGSVVSSAE
ncbi:hypothetical protein LOTGIDRAFT_162447 [Lottia gigantea]|uniref:Uncharacterized protein n=1 Tax=Lottia gigantea TaxID=225164 RepID=V4AGK1_LOTGI|nr:hypothetical protein LOTGIDRAFT_162447 [Lottia gigantea]ESO92541.1 hypothetical protein LOTGIDRAFT_162447 [Lottia gigantea]